MVVFDDGTLVAHPTRVGSVEEWTYVLAHGLLHLGFGHMIERPNSRAWNLACDYVVARFLADLKLGRPPECIEFPREFPVRTEKTLYQYYVEQGVPAASTALGTAGPNAPDMMVDGAPPDEWRAKHRGAWQAAFSEGLVLAVTSAVNVAAGAEPFLGSQAGSRSRAERARQWFISSYPLLGAMAASFTVYEDALLCQRMDISVAAIHEQRREIYINPAAGLSELECRFVMAHELLHVGLRHDARVQGRDHYLFNVACDYVINGWLIEMGVGEIPAMGLLHDPALKGESAESIYDRLTTDLRAARKLCTLRGPGRGDILEPSDAGWRKREEGLALDEFCRRAMANGLAYHCDHGRGFLPAGLIEEINSLSQPPIRWDVELAMWFDHHFPPIERHRTYARPSRRETRRRTSPVPDTFRRRIPAGRGRLALFLTHPGRWTGVCSGKRSGLSQVMRSRTMFRPFASSFAMRRRTIKAFSIRPASPDVCRCEVGRNGAPAGYRSTGTSGELSKRRSDPGHHRCSVRQGNRPTRARVPRAGWR